MKGTKESQELQSYGAWRFTEISSQSKLELTLIISGHYLKTNSICQKNNKLNSFVRFFQPAMQLLSI